MQKENTMAPGRQTWVMACAAGWVLSLVTGLAAGALAGVAGLEGQWALGPGIVLGMGGVQAWVLRSAGIKPAGWMLTYAVFFVPLFAMVDALSWLFEMPADVFVAGALVTGAAGSAWRQTDRFPGLTGGRPAWVGWQVVAWGLSFAIAAAPALLLKQLAGEGSPWQLVSLLCFAGSGGVFGLVSRHGFPCKDR